MPPGDACPTDDQLARLKNGLATEEELRRLDPHLQSCPRCAQRLESHSPADSVMKLLGRSPPTEQEHSTTAAFDHLVHRLHNLPYRREAVPAVANVRAAETSRADAALGLSTLQRVDQVREQFEHAWQGGDTPRISEFLDSQGSVFRAALLEVLLPIDVEYRRKTGQSSSVQSYLSELPDDAPVVARVLGSQTPHAKGAAPTHGMATERGETGTLPAVGERLEEFQILQELGRGAFGTVFRAWQTGVDREVALKVTKSRSHEPRTMAHLDGHPHIVRIYDERTLSGRGLHLLYMEFVHGVTLREVLSRRLTLPTAERDRATIAELTTNYDQVGAASARPAGTDRRTWTAQVCMMGAQIAEALDFAHRRDVRHCDIKPANILLTEAGIPKLVDFNVSHRPDFEQLGVGGTLAYMSPEQLRAFRAIGPERAELANRLDGRSDLYSLGIVLWEALVGVRPFQDVPGAATAEGTLSAMVQQRQEEPVRRALSALPKCVPRIVREVLGRCLAESPEERYATGSELAHQLRLCCDAELSDLLYPPEGWRDELLDAPKTWAIMLSLGLVGNVILTAIDIAWNNQVLNQPHLAEFSWSYSYLLVPAINFVAYTGGAVAGTWNGWPILRALRDGPQPAESQDPGACDSTVWLGHYAAIVALVSWIAAAIAYGVFVARGSGAAQDTIQVTASALLAGMIAAPLTFFPVTYFCVHFPLPRLLRETRYVPSLDMERHLGFYLGLLLFVPLLAIGASQLAPGGVEGFRLMLLSLVLIDVVGLSLALWCFLGIRRDLALLEKLHFRREDSERARR